MRAKKTKSGKWRCQLFIDGHNKSFTAPTKQEAEWLAMEYKRTYSPHRASQSTLGDAVDNYIAQRSNTLSPSTLRAYKSYQRGVLSDICETRLKDLGTETLQAWINAHAPERSAKTLKNAVALCVSAIKVIDPSFTVSLTFPTKPNSRPYIPTRADVDALTASTTNENVRKAILLAAFCSMRRSEACAVRMDDIDFAHGTITVQRAMVEAPDGTFQIKPYTKTADSFRTVPAPGFVLDAMRTGPITCTPNAITRAFEHVVKRAGLPHTRFHDLRHFYASYLHAQNIPDSYIEQFGGWRQGSNVMRNVYRNALRDEQLKQADKIISIFEKPSTKPSNSIKKA